MTSQAILIKGIRKDLNLSQMEFSRLFQIPYATLTKWEQGTALPPMRYLSWLSDVAGERPPKGEVGIEALIADPSGGDDGCRRWIYTALHYPTPLEALDAAKRLVRDNTHIVAVRLINVKKEEICV